MRPSRRWRIWWRGCARWICCWSKGGSGTRILSWDDRRFHPRPFQACVMAQLSDDCFAFGGALLGVDAALALIDERVTPVVEEEAVLLAKACGRVLARDLVAEIDVPPHSNSAVDGFAVAHADLSPGHETVLPITGRAAAGHPLGGT